MGSLEWEKRGILDLKTLDGCKHPDFGRANAYLHICTFTFVLKEYTAVPKVTLQCSNWDIILYT